MLDSTTLSAPMTTDRSSYAARVICLYLDHPDTPDVPSSADWDIARGLFDRGLPFDRVQFAFTLAYIRRHHRSGDPLPPIRSLAYFRTVAINLSPEETDPAYEAYIRDLYQRIRQPETRPATQPPLDSGPQTPDSRGSS